MKTHGTKEANFTTTPAAPQKRFSRWGAPLCLPSGTSSKVPALGPSAAPSRPALKRQRQAGLAAAAKRVAVAGEIRQWVKAIQDRAAAEEWSGRETAKRTGINRMDLSRLGRSEGRNLEAWLPKLRAAVAKLRSLQ